MKMELSGEDWKEYGKQALEELEEWENASNIL